MVSGCKIFPSHLVSKHSSLDYGPCSCFIRLDLVVGEDHCG